MRAEAQVLARWRWPRRGRGLLGATLVLAAVALLFRFALPAPAGPAVTRIAVAVPPNPLLSATAIRAAAAPAVRGGLLDLDLDAVRARVEALPWVAQATVRRLWPDAIAIDVVLERPVARWGAASLIDARGHVFSPPEATRFKALPSLTGPRGTGRELLATLNRARALLAPAGLTAVALSENERGELRVTLASGLEIELGRDRPLPLLARFVRVAVPALGGDLARAAAVDMRYPNGFAVAWRDNNPDGGNHGQKD